MHQYTLVCLTIRANRRLKLGVWHGKQVEALLEIDLLICFSQFPIAGWDFNPERPFQLAGF